MVKRVIVDGLIYHFYGNCNKTIDEILEFVEKKAIENMKEN